MSSNAPTRFNLTAFSEFRASHTLEGFRVPHFHLWKISVSFNVPYPLKGDRVVDLVFAELQLEELIAPLKGSLLEDALKMSPTSENLCIWLWRQWSERVQDWALSAVSVTLCDLEGRPSGKAELRA